MKTIKRGEEAPYGFFRWEGEPQFLCLMLPLFPWYGVVYDGAWDQKVTGWHLKMCFLKLSVGDKTVKATKREDPALL